MFSKWQQLYITITQNVETNHKVKLMWFYTITHYTHTYDSIMVVPSE